MKFALFDKDRKQMHEGIAATVKQPDVITWAHRAFVRSDAVTERGQETVRYVEVSAYRIGS